MPDWDAQSTLLRSNLKRVLSEIAVAAEIRETPSLKMAKRWHRGIMVSLKAPKPYYVGSFRGEPGLERVQVKVGGALGIRAEQVAAQLDRFEQKLVQLVADLDVAILPMGELTADQLAAIIDLCAWVHAEWVRIHPFANGNGRVARLWANFIAMRYGLPPFVRLRPRPNGGYAEAGVRAMRGEWQPTVVVFWKFLNEALEDA